MQASVEIVVESRGGSIVAVYSSDPNARIVVVDWDEFDDSGRPGFLYPIDPMSQMPRDTQDMVGRAFDPSAARP